MKKLLSLLSVLTISGTAAPTTIAASPYQKRENLNIDINYQQKNNLKRTKRQNNNFPENESPILRVSDNVNDYFKDLCQIIEYLQRNNIIRAIRGQIGPWDPGNPLSCGIDGHTPRENYFINPNQTYSYFIIPIAIENNGQSKMIKLVFRSSDFYLQGFINNGNYYYFNEENNLNNIHGYDSNRLNFNGSYTNLIPSGNPKITWPGIQDAFFQLSNMGTLHQPQEIILRASLARVILSTSESIRFREVQNLIINSASTHNFPGIRVYWERDFVPIIKEWNKITKAAIDYLLTNNNLIGFDRIQNILVFTYIISNYFNSCNNNNIQMRDLNNNNNNNNNEYCPILERVFYHKEDKSPLVFKTGWQTKMNVGISGKIDLGDVNPINYKKIDFLGDDSNLYTKISWGNTPYYGKSIKDFFNERNNCFHDIIVDSGTINPTLGQIQFEKQKELIKISDKQGLASFEGNIKFGLSFYWKNNHFYLRRLHPKK